ncbi:peptidoglycan-binding protein [Mesorhizobium sp. RMAD-H1]|uniref:peptidoglycan-binding protein n=1 Tax=Mesorhizobium sp. RMAD-H1 TaxID=2587065 RepID=UPI00160E99E6|nr:peptidoglycan-binding protein [Mesorhizobium sp. RMAD-H1]MBB2969638.1 localization factor PodJL [Mesorhizobium sp. RMAD-H1]
MKNQRSPLEDLNAQRVRRMPSPLDELNRTLEGLEKRLNDLDAPQTGSQRRPFLQDDAFPAYAPAREAAHGGQAREENARHRRQDADGFSAIAAELKQLRGELRQEMSSTMRREFEVLNHDMQRLRQSVLAEGYSAQLGAELSRISENVQALSERTDNETAHGLQRDLEELKRTVQTLAREESLRRLSHRWDEFDERFDAFEQRQSARDSVADPAIEALTARLEQIRHAIDTLPQSQSHSIRNLEDRINVLAGTIEKIARPQGQAVPPQFMQQMDERLDEISRAILSSSISRRPEQDEAKRLERIEARLAGLASQIEAAEHRAAMPDPTFIREIDRRFEELAQRLDDHYTAGSGYDMRLIENLEGRLEDISQQLSVSAAAQSVSHSGFPGHEVFRNLETQVAEIARHLSQPSPRLPELEDIRPRLDSIERSLMSSRETMLDAARQAAEDAIRHVMKNGSAGDAAIARQLAHDLKSLEALARGSDERSTRTFEAIHDTLMKIVDRLGKLEQEVSRPVKATGPHNVAPDSRKSVIGAAPALQFEAEPDLAHSSRPRSPAAAAAEAALAAIKSDGQISAAEPDERDKKKSSMFGGLAKAVKGRGRSDLAAQPATQAPKAEPSFASGPKADIAEPREAADPGLANQPLEPGSGMPDLNTIMKRVRDERRERGNEPAGEIGKADFIIAARRAAQAAAAESERLKKAGEKPAARKRSALGDMLHRQRKPILMAIGAIMLAMAGLQIGTAFLAPGDREAIFGGASDRADTPAAAPQIDPNSTSAVPQADTEQPHTAPAPDTKVEATPPPAEEPAMATPPAPHADAAPQAEQEAPAPVEAPAPATTAENNPLPAIPEIPAEIGPAALREAAAKGDPKALFEIGNRYTDGRGVQSDYAKATQWYELSAGLGFAPAQYRLGNFNEKGLGMPRDTAKAKTWYQLAAQQGNASAMHNLAVLFAMGPDGAPDNESAARWFGKAAELGVKDSQFNLGILSAKGLGVPRNLEESYKWFALAARSGDKDAEQKREAVAKVLKPEQLERAKAAVELWKVKPLDEAANSIDVPDAWQESQPQTTSSVDMKKAVRNIQLILAKSGYDPGAADGVMGAKTREAITAFQKARGLTPTGEVDQPLVEALLKQNELISVAAKQ